MENKNTESAEKASLPPIDKTVKPVKTTRNPWSKSDKKVVKDTIAEKGKSDTTYSELATKLGRTTAAIQSQHWQLSQKKTKKKGADRNGTDVKNVPLVHMTMGANWVSRYLSALEITDTTKVTRQGNVVTIEL